MTFRFQYFIQHRAYLFCISQVSFLYHLKINRFLINSIFSAAGEKLGNLNIEKKNCIKATTTTTKETTRNINQISNVKEDKYQIKRDKKIEWKWIEKMKEKKTHNQILNKNRIHRGTELHFNICIWEISYCQLRENL